MTPMMLRDFGTVEQQSRWMEPLLQGDLGWCFGLTEAAHGSDATWMETRAERTTRDGVSGWSITGEKMWTTGLHKASHVLVFARHAGEDGSPTGIGCFVTSTKATGFEIGEYLWTFNMPTDHPRLSVNNVWVPDEAILGVEGRGLALAQSFVHQNRIRQAASSLGAAQYCVEESVKYARTRKPFGEELARNQAIQFPLVELATQCEMLRLLIYKTAWDMDLSLIHI